MAERICDDRFWNDFKEQRDKIKSMTDEEFEEYIKNLKEKNNVE